MDLKLQTTEYNTSKNIWASTSGRRYASFTIDSASVPVDASTNKRIVMSGTAFAKLVSGKFAPYDAAQFGTTQSAPIYYIDKDFDCTLADQAVQGAYSGVLKMSRLVTAPDDNIKNNMRTMDFR